MFEARNGPNTPATSALELTLPNHERKTFQASLPPEFRDLMKQGIH
jgi:hypothetical protein